MKIKVSSPPKYQYPPTQPDEDTNLTIEYNHTEQNSKIMCQFSKIYVQYHDVVKHGNP